MFTLVTQFLSGAIFMGYVAGAMLFFRFWRRTGDRLFVLFTVAFVTLALERIILLALSPMNEIAPYVYLVRMTAFLIIIAAIVDKNRK